MPKKDEPAAPYDSQQETAENHVREIMGPSDSEESNGHNEASAPAAEPVSHFDDKKVHGDADDENDLNMDHLPDDFHTDTIPDDATTAAAVDDILKQDADIVLEGAPPAKAVVMKPSAAERLKNVWFLWWENRWSRYGTIAVGVVLAAVIILVKPVHDAMLNAVGVRSSVTVTVLDGANNLPLQHAVLSVGTATAKTNSDGRATVRGVRLGKHEVRVSKTAFAPVKKQVDFGMRITDLGEVTLKAVGVQLTYQVSDYLSGKPLADVEFSNGEASAKSDKKGKAVITLPPTESSENTITIKKSGYRTEKSVVDTANQTTMQQKLVPSAPAVYVSKKNGTYDVYRVDIDGKNQSVLLAGSGLENQSIAVLPSPSGDKVVVASTRDEKRNADNYLLTALNLVDTATGEIRNLEYAEQITLLGWHGNTLVYLQTVAGTSAANPNRQKIIAYDFTANKRFQLASANYFAGTALVGNTLYYTVSATDPAAQETFTRINLDGTAKKTLFSGQVWSLSRMSYDKLKIQTPDKWYEYTIGAASPTESTPIADYSSQRYYVDSPTGDMSVRPENRDINGLLMLYSAANKKEKVLVTQKNMQTPQYWLTDRIVVYRVAGQSEVADYAVSTDGGSAKKIADVSPTSLR